MVAEQVLLRRLESRVRSMYRSTWIPQRLHRADATHRALLRRPAPKQPWPPPRTLPGLIGVLQHRHRT